MAFKLCKWRKWDDREEYEGIKYPGIYVIAISSTELANQKFTYCDEIVYVGMTNAVAGLKGRLRQFDNTIVKPTGSTVGQTACSSSMRITAGW